jgi:hypothetical protein
MPIPKLPDSFSFDEEILVAENNKASLIKAQFSYKLKATSFSLTDSKINTYKKYIQDFNSGSAQNTASFRISKIKLFSFIFFKGIGYNIDKETGRCEIYSLGSSVIDQNDETIVQTQYGSFIDLKTPEKLFYIDDSYYYAGERYERGILSRVWTSNRSDITNLNSNVTYFINEIYMKKVVIFYKLICFNIYLNFSVGFQLSQIEERAVPISVHASFPQVYALYLYLIE